MLNSPSTSPPNLAMALLFCAGGIIGIVQGVKVITRREITAGTKKGGPYTTFQGRDAIKMGLGIALFSLGFFVLGVLCLIYLYKTP